MRRTNRAWFTGLASVALTAGIATAAGGAQAALASPVAPNVVSVAAQAAATNTVDTFLAAHPQPHVVTKAASVADQNAYWATEVSYWQSVPWGAIAEQSGCILKSVNIERDSQPDANGVYGAGYSSALDCGPAPSATVATAATTIETLAHVSTPTSRTTSTPSTLASPAGADAYLLQGCGTSGNTKDCLYSDQSTLVIKSTVTWLANSTTTGQVRLSHTALTGCSAGTTVATGLLSQGVQGTLFTLTHSWTEDTRWETQWLISGARYSEFCATF
jgi:hypothetical protein